MKKIASVLISILFTNSLVFAEAIPQDLSEKRMLAMFAAQRARIALLEQKIDRLALQESTHQKKADDMLSQLQKSVETDYQKKAIAEAEFKNIRDTISNNYLTSFDAAQTYITKSAADNNYLTKATANAVYLTRSTAASTYLTGTQVTDSVKNTLRNCRVHLGWSDSNRSSPDQSISRSLLGERDDNNRIRMSGDVNGDDALFLWTSC